WDVARFEVSGHRWADLSESGYGVSVLNDCKYGWDIKDNVIRLSLLRSPTNPDPLADKGEHDFTYSLYPHAGSWQDGTVQAAQELNAPMQAIATDAHTGELGSTHSFVSVDKPNVIIDAVKQAEDTEDIIVRVYEAYGARGPVKMTFDRPIKQATECNLLEEDDTKADFNGCEVQFTIKPFEIRTFKLKLV
ncbi:glycosyl hydrolase-related protein, partial [bacterium]|nr:glycosyl hydrolase-related protein [bacterium]